MKKLFFIHLLTVCGGTFGLNLLWPQIENLQEHSCDNSLLENTLDMFPHSLYYIRPYHCEHHKEHERAKLLSQYNASSSKSEPKVCISKWIENVQENRIPRTLMTAECESACESVSYALSVLKIEYCELGYSVYRPEIQTISVACVPKYHQSERNPGKDITRKRAHVKSTTVKKGIRKKGHRRKRHRRKEHREKRTQENSPHLVHSDNAVGSNNKELPMIPRHAAKSNSQRLVHKLEMRSLVDNSSSVTSHHIVRTRIGGSPIGDNLVQRNAVTSSDQPEASTLRNSLIPSHHVVRSVITNLSTSKKLLERLAVTTDYKLEDPE